MRVTWYPAPSFAHGWTPDGSRVLYASSREMAPTDYERLWTVDTHPVWLGGTICFRSDRDNATNVWTYTVASGQLAQVTRFRDADVKWLSAGAGSSSSSRTATCTRSTPPAAR